MKNSRSEVASRIEFLIDIRIVLGEAIGMTFLSLVLVFLVGALQVYFMFLEMFLWTKPKGLKVFRQSLEDAMKTKVLAQNQGLYNGFLAAGLFWGLFHPDPAVGVQLKICFLLFVLIAGVYGAWTANKKIIYVQALPAAMALIFVIFSH